MKTLLLVILLLALFTGFFLLAFLIPRKYYQTSNVVYPDENYNCVSGRVYDPSRDLCVVPQGGACKNFADCESQSYCNGGICTSRDVPQGGVDENCPCNPGLVCDSNGKCKYSNRSVCTASVECLSGYCMNSDLNECLPGQSCLCTDRLANGNVCIESKQCLSGNCSLGICQFPGLTTGDAGSYCIEGTRCSRSTCYDNICQEGNHGFYETCNICAPSLTCSTSPSSPGANLASPGANLASPGNCVTSSNCRSCDCMPGYTCRNGLCYGNINALVSIPDQCNSGQSSGKGGIASLSYPLYASIPEWKSRVFQSCESYELRDSNNIYLQNTDNLYLATSNGDIRIVSREIQSFCLSDNSVYTQDKNGEYFRDGQSLSRSSPLNQGMAYFQGQLYLQFGNSIQTSNDRLYSSDVFRILRRGYITNTSRKYISFEGEICDLVSNLQDADLILTGGKWSGIVLTTQSELYLLDQGIVYPFKSYYFNLRCRVRYQDREGYYLSNAVVCAS